MLDITITLNAIGQQVTDRLRHDIKNKSLVSGYPAPNASGKLYESIYYKVENNVLRVYAEDYIYYLQYGRKPGKFPPVNVIREWVQTKLGITDEKERNSIAYLIGRKIANEGTLIYKQGGSTLLTDIINAESIREWRDEISAILVTQIQSDILKLAA
jgi:hypothetical protein